MQTKNLFRAAIFFIFMLALVPSVSQAYVSTKQTSLRLSDNMLMFMVTYEFGHENLSYKMPVVAKRNAVSSDALGYNILKDGKLRTNTGVAKSVVLSNAKTEAGKYVVLPGEKKEFTLITFLTLPADRNASSTDYALAVSSLPFELGKEGVYLKNQLNKSELTKYKTPIIGTNQKLAITTKTK